jgi:hypothetical protein
LTVDPRWGFEWAFACPFDADDESRPCWPNHENGEPYTAEAGARFGCNYDSWWGEDGAEMVVGMPPTVFPVVDVSWTGDGFELTLGAATYEHVEGQ